jgi:hypothetical protein
MLESRNKIQALFQSIRNMNDEPALLSLTIDGTTDKIKEDTNQFINGYPKIKKEYEKEKIEEKKPHRLRELVITYNGILQKQSEDNSLKKMLDEFDKDSQIKAFKTEIKTICSMYTDQEFSNIISNTIYYSSLIKYFRTLKTLFLKEDMYEIVLNDLTYQDRNPSEIKEMDALIEKEVKNYYDYRQAFKHIDEDRVISNIYWKKEADIINGEAGFIESSDLTKKKSLFEIVLRCNKNNKACQNNKMKEAVSHLEIGLEQINRKDKTSFTYEAYINLEVVEGVYNETNYHKLMCPYIDNVLGDAYDEMIRKEGKNIVMRNRVFVKAMQPIQAMQPENKKEKTIKPPLPPPPNPRRTIKNKNKKKRKSGGTKKKKRFME